MHHGQHYDHDNRRGLGSWLRSRLLLGGLGYVIYRLWKRSGSTRQGTARIGNAGSGAGATAGEGASARAAGSISRG
ncbi:MAG: hypothetical protein HEQ16_08350 [Bosea sp.]|jgi:hypothetical protein|nr:hypothetical protein [Bosea sp. (in: a-proteobacteria)]